jgi:glutamine amidotransferase
MKSPEVTVVDYGVGNLLSVRRALQYCGANVTVSSEPAVILGAPRIVLPGVGAFANAMRCLEQRELAGFLREAALRGTPLLGICLGMQLLLDESDEFGVSGGLRLVSGRVVEIPSRTANGTSQKVPHIGWSGLEPPASGKGWQGTILEDVRPGEAMYFVHSFMAVPDHPAHRVANCNYGGISVAAVVGRENVVGCQFHPEKSGPAGLKVLRSFLKQ